ncbi:ABATE domain-containing protein [Streptomyces sp. TRM66268-LWL]|uniref:ABATE domain-containing protein n=1 Tax=Streptomyces polyasparticus TaxID=2767826 RepID=A0ABR7SV45_9ACTN|nr:ABATE domain-containing protein [Streptomyces polyasparticus]MBC9719355.1 ABATE domain-containing protein [Streptomyces polyasparticus]
MTVTTGPQLGDPLPVELANATYAVRGRLQDGLRTVEQLAQWLAGVHDRLAVPLTEADLRSVGEADLARAREIRDAVRDIAVHAVREERPAPGPLRTLNRHAAAAPCRRELRWAESPRAVVRGDGPAVTVVLGAIAQDAVDLFAGPRLADLRACHGPGCVLFFVKDHPRREWCSPGCGNRARAARHYARVRDR